jgi:hypothetical protein
MAFPKGTSYGLFSIVGIVMFFALGMMPNLASGSHSHLMCKQQMGERVCAVDMRTGQCTHVWSNRDSANPMFACQRFVGHDTGRVDRTKLYCRDFGMYTCAVSRTHGQCTLSWSRRDHHDPMWQCEKYLGKRQSNYDPRNYVCKTRGDSVCAQDIRTGQCTHEWNRRDSYDPLASCQRFLNSQRRL